MLRLHYRQGRAGLSVAPRSVLRPSVAGFQAGESLGASSAHLLHIRLLPLLSTSSGLSLLLALSGDLSVQCTVHFGSTCASDYTQHRDPVRKQRYLARHTPREDWDNPMTAGALARWILWDKETLPSSIEDYTRRFNLAAV